jgi:SpoVK/Ycf46/Vps4 family AAA+-type ATPase
MNGHLFDMRGLEDQAIIYIGDDEEHPSEYSMWFQEGTEFVPSVNIRTVNKIPSGAYKVTWKRDDWHVIPVPINTDELYTFSNDITSKLVDETKLFWNKSEAYKENNIAHKRGILLCGEPGCGKSAIITMLIAQLIKQDGIIFIVNNVQEFNNLNECLSSIIRQIEPTRPVITVIEDVDQIIKNMNGDWQILDFLDGKNSINHHLVILTSNDTTDLSEALLRPSRIDWCIEIPSPSDTIRREYFIKKNINEDLLDEFVRKTEDMSFAELKEVFIGTQILGKPLEKVVEQIRTPFECKDYLSKTNEIKVID